jgi:hypothetical protein
LDAVKEEALKVKATNSDVIRSTVGATGSGEVNPLLADARKRAGK